MIPEHIVNDVRRAVDIVDVISEFVRLRKRGKNYIGLCPFHVEKTPSFNVNPQMQVYKCFGCGKGGNVFGFLMESEKVSFLEAVRALAQRAGIALPDDRRSDDEKITPFDQIYSALRFAANFFYTNLNGDERHAKFIREDYFKNQRGLTDATIRTFGLGAAPRGWDGLLLAAHDEGIPDDVLAQSGLVKKREDGGYYDAFRDRAMFPIVNVGGRVVGFGARKVFDDDPLAKYINSPESQVYNKSRILYGIFQAKDALRKEDRAFLVEGYMDLISLHQHGVQNVVASSGTSLTEGQVELLSRYTRNVVIVYDADAAGAAAATRGIDIMLEKGMHVRVLVLPAGDDPDTFVRREGADAFRRLADKAESFVTYNAAQLRAAGMFDSPEKQAEAARVIVQSIAKIPDPIERTFTIRSVATEFDLYETDLQRELERVMKPSRRTQPRRDGERSDAGDEAPPSRRLSDITAGEADLLRALVRGGAAVASFAFESLQPEDLQHPLAQSLAAMIQEELREHGEVSYERLMERAEDAEVREFLAGLPFNRDNASARWETMDRPNVEADAMRIARDAVRSLRRDSLERRKRELQKALGESPDPSIVIRAIMDVDAEIRELAGSGQ